MATSISNRSRIKALHNINISGGGPVTLLLVHGYGCSQVMWRHVLPALEEQSRVVRLDLIGFGSSDYRAYDLTKYATLNGHAEDVLRIAEEFAEGPVVLVGHSVGAMIGVLADLSSPGHIAAHAMVAPTPCLHNDNGYRGGLDRAEIPQLLTFLDAHFWEWAREMAALIAGSEPDSAKIAAELVTSFCQAESSAARQLARAIFNMDLRAKLPAVTKPTLVLQSANDGLAYVGVGQFVRDQIAGSDLRIVSTSGHCPHLTAPDVCSEAILSFAARIGSPRAAA